MSSLRIVFVFLAFGCTWILVSDRAVDALVADVALRTSIQSVKGIAFVLLSALLVYALVRHAETVQKAARKAVSREKDHLANILNVNPGVVYALKPGPAVGGEWEIDFVGHNVERMTGYALERWLDEPDLWRKHIHPDDAAQVALAQQELLREGTVSHEYRFLHGDGHYRWISDHLIVQRDASGAAAQIIGNWLDISDRKQAELTIRQSEKRYRTLFDANPLPMWVYDLETLRFLSVNEAAQFKYGYSRDEFLAMTVRDIRPPEDVAALEARLDSLQREGNRFSATGEWRHRRKDGTVFWVEISGHTLVYGGRPARLILATDVTHRREAEERLRLIGQVFQSSQEGIFITDAHNRFISVNAAFCRATGYSLDEVVGKGPALLSSGRHDKVFYQTMWSRIASQGHWEGEIWNRRKTGEIYPEWLTISAIRDADGQVSQYLGIFTETSSRKAAEERIQHLANYDMLTGLPNRALLSDRVKVAIAGAQRSHSKLAVMHVNVDRFKTVNELMGHESGDQVLVTLAKRLVGCLKPDDTVSRMGGDDFIILLPHTTVGNVAQIALRVMTQIAEPLFVGEQEIRLTASIGIAEYPENGQDLAQLTQAAEFAVNQAKRNGRNTFQFYSDGMQEQVKQSLAMESDLRFAVERGQLVLYYQPQIDLKTQRIIGLEALVRWRHPQWGLVPPARFIPIAEESGLIRGIGDWVLREALRQNAVWKAQGLAVVPMAINLSIVQFRHAGLRETVREAIAQSGMPAAMVELELTESVAMENSDFTIATIDGLKSLGVALSIDDFGTGYSSLSYLKRFNIDKLKIDQSFVRGLNVDRDDEAIVATVITLAQKLGLRTIAEGVETVAQRDFLREAGCDEFQGYLCSPPVPADNIADMLGNATVNLE